MSLWANKFNLQFGFFVNFVELLFFRQVREKDLETAIMCLSENYKIFKDSGSGLEPVTLSIKDRLVGMNQMNERKAGKFPVVFFNAVISSV